MENQETIDYIRKHLAGGHSEAILRKHFLTYGWSQAKVDNAFEQYYSSIVPKPSAKSASKLRQRPKKTKWSRARLVRTASVLVILAGALVGVHLFMSHKTVPVISQKVVNLSYHAKQTNDINTVAGAVGQYVAANNGILPTRLSVSANQSLVMCNATCDPTTSEVASLSVYQASAVRLMPYEAGLTVPDQQTMYLVALAKCMTNGGIGGVNSNLRSMVILYAELNGFSLSQHCIVL